MNRETFVWQVIAIIDSDELESASELQRRLVEEERKKKTALLRDGVLS